jgi:hypothetical protein
MQHAATSIPVNPVPSSSHHNRDIPLLGVNRVVQASHLFGTEVSEQSP